MAEKDDVILKIKEKIAKLDKDSAQSYKEQLKALNDSNAALGTYKNLLEDINTRIEDQLEGFAGLLKEIKEINGELENEGKHVKDATKAFRGLESIASKLKNDQKGYTELNKEQLNQEKSKIKILQDQFEEAAKQIQLRGAITDEEKAIVAAYENQNGQFKRTLALLNDRIEKEEEINKKLGVTGALLTGISKIPIVGPLLKTNEALDLARKKAQAGGNAFQVMGTALGSVGKSLISNLFDPLVTIGLTVKIFKELLDLGFRLDKQVVSLQKAFYLSRVEAQALQDRFQNITDTNNVLVKGLNDSLITRENQVEAAIQLSNVMGAVGRVTDQEVQSQIKLTKQMGLSVEEGQALYVLGRQNKMTSSEVVDEITKQVKATQKQHGFLLDTKKVTQDVSKITGQLRLQYGNNVKQLASAVIQSNKLGFSLEQTKKIAEGLLNFEESIENELSAELLIGRDLNLEQARLLALNGKSAEATALIAQNMGGSAGFAAMNVIQQEALAKALNMSADELANSIMQQENLGNLKEEDKKRLEDEIGRLKERGELEKAQQLERAAANGADIESAIESINKQDEFNNNVKKIKESLEGLLSGPAFQLAEWVTSMVKNSETLQSVLKGVAYIVGGALLVSLGKALVSMSALVLEAIAYAVTWAITNPIAAAAGAIIAGGIAATISSEISSAKSKNKPTNPNYATGGIVGGSSLAGDNMKINANSGEMVLNRRQQANLFKLANGGGGGGPIQVTVYGQIDKKTLFTFMAEGERTNSNNLASERQLNNRPTQ
jgi:hypothetical protein